MDKVAQHNNGVKYFLMAVDVLPRYFRVQLMKALYAKGAVEAFKKRSRRNSQRKYGQTRDRSSKEISKNFVKRREFIYTQQKTTLSQPSRRGTFDRLKTFFANIWRKNGLGRILKICPSF